MSIKHCAFLECVNPFSFRIEGRRGRSINVKYGDIFWNTTPAYEQKRTNIAKIARKGKNMGCAYPFPLEIIEKYFIVGS